MILGKANVSAKSLLCMGYCLISRESSYHMSLFLVNAVCLDTKHKLVEEIFFPVEILVALFFMSNCFSM